MKEQRFILKKSNRGISSEEIVEDIKQVAHTLGKSTLSYKEYRSGGGKLDSTVIHRRIGSWNKALRGTKTYDALRFAPERGDKSIMAR